MKTQFAVVTYKGFTYFFPKQALGPNGAWWDREEQWQGSTQVYSYCRYRCTLTGKKAYLRAGETRLRSVARVNSGGLNLCFPGPYLKYGRTA